MSCSCWSGKRWEAIVVQLVRTGGNKGLQRQLVAGK